eukprot:354903-Chlamydomonas_euryale.AAC.14
MDASQGAIAVACEFQFQHTHSSSSSSVSFTHSFRRHSWLVHAEKAKLEAKLRPYTHSGTGGHRIGRSGRH